MNDAAGIGRILVVALLLLCAATGATWAQTAPLTASPAASPPSAETPPSSGSSAWLIALAKTATYETLASIDALVLGVWWTGDGTTGTLFAATSAATAATAYYLHELAWNAFGPDPQQVDPQTLALWKTVSYRVVSATRVLTLTWLLTGSPLVSGTYIAVNTVIDAAIYYVNDLAWAKFGPPVERLRPNSLTPAASPR